MIETNKTNEKLPYQAPSLKVVSVQVERGFATSGLDNTPRNLNDFVLFEDNQNSCFETYTTNNNFSW